MLSAAEAVRAPPPWAAFACDGPEGGGNVAASLASGQAPPLPACCRAAGCAAEERTVPIASDRSGRSACSCRRCHGLLSQLAAVVLALVGSPAPATDGAAESAEAPVHGTERGARHDGLGERHGLKLVYTADALANVAGGMRRATEYLGNVDLKSTIDADRLLGWKDTIFFVYLLNNHGGKPSENAGTAQAVSNIEAPSTTKLFEAWVQKSALEDRLSVLAGLYDLNSEFYVTETSELFLNDSFGTGKDLNQTGRNGPSIFPTTSAGLRIKAQPIPSLYLQTVALDGVPGDPDNPRGTHVRFAEGDGALIVAEVGYVTEGPSGRAGKYALGTWRYTARFDDLLDVDSQGLPRRRTDRGIYVLLEQGVYREANAPEQGLDAFLRYGRADPDVNRFARAVGAGIVYTGLVPGRPRDQVGLSFAKATNGDKYRRLQLGAAAPVTEAESVYELSYRAQVRPWLALQPDVQYMVDPGTDPTVKNAWVLGLRVEMSFEHDEHPW